MSRLHELTDVAGGKCARENEYLSKNLELTAQVAKVYIDDYAAQSGASLFLQERAHPQFSSRSNALLRTDWQYLKLMPSDTDILTHALVEDVKSLGGEWEVLDVVRVQNGVSLRNGDGGLLWDRLPHVRRKNALWILARR